MSDLARLVEWLPAQLDEDEEAALAAGGSTSSGRWAREADGCVIDAKRRLVVYGEGTPTREEADHIALHDPDRELREIEAKRLILAEHYIIERKVNWTDGEGEDRQTHLPVCVVCVPKYSYIGTRDQAVGPCKTVKLLALPYSDRPGYRPEWKPADTRT